MWSCFGDRFETVSNNYSGGLCVTGFYLGSPARQAISEIMDMDWEAKWGDLSNNESWAEETHFAGSSTQKAAHDLWKWWNCSLTLCFRDSTSKGTLCNRGGSTQTRQTPHEACQALSCSSNREILEKWALQMGAQGFPRRPDTFKAMAEKLTQEEGGLMLWSQTKNAGSYSCLQGFCPLCW